MPARERRRDGRYTERVTPEDVFDAFADTEGPSALSTELADVLDCSAGTVRDRLQTLDREGRVQQRQAGRQVLWWPKDADDE